MLAQPSALADALLATKSPAEAQRFVAATAAIKWRHEDFVWLRRPMILFGPGPDDIAGAREPRLLRGPR